MTQATIAARDILSPEVDQLAVQTIRFLAADMVEAAQSGHPGMPMGAAPMAWTLFSRHLRHDPADPGWADRDRFVLSAGHGSALQYALLHMFGYDLPMSELRAFRQLGSKTPGHPEVGHTVGVETTTGPLGQGLATAVGLALAERMQAARFPEITSHHTYVIVGDGCLMEGVSHEAASLAGHLGLGQLVALWDDNSITIDGRVDRSCSDDQPARFAAYGWHVVSVQDGTDIAAIDAALAAAKTDPRPSMIAVRTVIGHGAPGIEGTNRAHGSPLGDAVLAATKQAVGWDHPPFTVPDQVATACRALADEGRARSRTWREAHERMSSSDPARATLWNRTWLRALPTDWDAVVEDISKSLRPAGTATGLAERATRQWSHDVLNRLCAHVPELVGGSADLAGSTGVDTGQALVTSNDFAGSRVAFGIREFAMAAVLNGLSLHGGFRAYGSTFLVFSDYLRPALRLSALMRQPVVYVLTHDSIAVGEDGPTHQPVEHIEALRLIPGVRVLRPADDLETLAAWRLALERDDGPTVLVLSRQALPSFDAAAPNPAPGVRIVRDCEDPMVEIMATGSEVAIAVEAADLLAARGIPVRVLSVLDRDALATVTTSAAFTVAVEAGVSSGWRGLADQVIGIDQFGASGPGDQVLAHFGFSGPAVADRIGRLIDEADHHVDHRTSTTRET